MNIRNSINTYMFVVSFVGWLGVFLSLLWIKPLEYLLIIGLLIILLGVCEMFPVLSERGTLTFSFPIIFTIYLIQGLSFTAFTFATIIFLMNLIRKKPLYEAFFNSGYRSLSLIFALLITEFCFKSLFYANPRDIIDQTFFIFTATGLYFLIKCSLYELYMKLRGTTSPLSYWKKYIGAFIIFLFSFFYCWLMFFLGHQDRGRTDAFSFFFFFAPLIAVTIVYTIIARLEREKKRLNMLFAITNEFKQGIATANVATKIIEEIRLFLPIDSTVLWIRENNSWKVNYRLGNINSNVAMDESFKDWLESIKDAIYVPYKGAHRHQGIKFFDDDKNQSFIFVPLFIEDELLGVWGIGSHNAYAFQKDDLLSIKALANQIAIIVRTRKLIQEQENHKILEERNRIAREIHDGIAQRVAGAVMNLEAANKSFDTRVDESRKLVQESLVKLRGSLKDIRQSIYALRPHPTQQVGIIQALQDLIVTFEQENPKLQIHFQVKGKETSLGYLIENALFNVLKEALRNIQKHAQASMINITINFKKTQVILRIKDNGLGFSLMDAMIKAKNEPHFGIINMQELADNMGATLDIFTKKGSGTEITLVVPKITEGIGGSDDKRHVSG